MSNTVSIRALSQYVGQTVRVQGWLQNCRAGGKILFLLVRDGTGYAQCIIEKSDETAGFFEDAKHLPQESSLRVIGAVRADERSPGGVEVVVSGFEIVHKAGEFPITPKAHGVDFLQRHRHLWLRSRRQHAILSIRATLIDAVRRFFNDNGFTLIDTPIFAPSAGEGARTLFEVDYFGEPVYLAQTGQLYLEAACMSHGKVYCFGPTFRAEKSKTRRHLTEFWMVEPEIAYAELDDVVAVAEDFICSIVGRVLNDHRKDLEFLERDIKPLGNIRKPFYRLSYSECVDILRGPRAVELLDGQLAERTTRRDELRAEIDRKEAELKTATKKWQQEKLAQEIQAARMEVAELDEQIENIPTHKQLAQTFEWGKDLGGSDETIISQLHDRPVVVHRYPRQAKAFYMKTDRSDPRVVLNFDMLAPEGYGEIIGGSQREDDLETLVARMDEEKLPHEPYEWYLDLRRYGSVPHGGFGLGIERTLAWITGARHIREMIPFPRMMGRLYP
jgi:asparaginyl-tRNA synthetase